MCFRITYNGKKTATIAKKDIIAYKVLKYVEGKLISPYNYMSWKKGLIVKIGGVKSNDSNEIDIGLHCKKTIEGAIEFMGFINVYLEEEAMIYYVIIPKGARYWENVSEYVSNKMILKSGIPLKYERKRKAVTF